MSILETPRNTNEKTLACLVLDRSGSMGGVINQLNQGVHNFLEDMRNDPKMATHLEVSIVAFDNHVDTIQEPDLADHIDYQGVTAGGTTALVDAVREAINIVEKRKAEYDKQNIPRKLPWIVVVTDGYETEKPNEVADLAQQIEHLTKQQKFMLMPVAVNEEGLITLKEIAGYKKTGTDSNGNPTFIQVKPVMLGENKFTEFFEWLSASVSALANSTDGQDMVLQSPEDAGWGRFPTM